MLAQAMLMLYCLCWRRLSQQAEQLLARADESLKQAKVADSLAGYAREAEAAASTHAVVLQEAGPVGGKILADLRVQSPGWSQFSRVLAHLRVCCLPEA